MKLIKIDSMRKEKKEVETQDSTFFFGLSITNSGKTSCREHVFKDVPKAKIV